MAAGFTACCEAGDCRGTPPTCYCDALCHSLGDCCDDIDETCPAGKMELLQLSYQEVSRLSWLGWCQHTPNACTLPSSFVL